MTDQELIARLLAEETDLTDCAADRIEELEAKLAVAVAGLRKIADHKHFSWDQGWIQNTEARIASATLAELEVKE